MEDNYKHYVSNLINKYPTTAVYFTDMKGEISLNKLLDLVSKFDSEDKTLATLYQITHLPLIEEMILSGYHDFLYPLINKPWNFSEHFKRMIILKEITSS